MATTLRLAKDLTLPLDAVSRTFGILAVRGAGKSNTAAVMAEEMFAASLPFCVIDPVGSWYGLRSSADGKKAGLAIPIFGGKHGDVPLERGAGELLADLVVEKRLTCVLDLSRFNSEGDKKAFLLAFAQRLYQRNENPLHLFLEEADDYIPQKPMRDEAQLLRAWENIVRRGRSRGLGMTLITQRSAAVAKMVLTQVETLFAMRTTGPQDIAAIEAWIKYHQVDQNILSTLASLEDGEAWVWSPHYLKTMSRHQIRRRETFDSGATPKNVHAADKVKPATLADIDLSALQERMAATIEKAKADDPRELRRRIKELEKAASGSSHSNESKKQEAALTDADRLLLNKLAAAITETGRLLMTNVSFDLSDFLAQFEKRLQQFKTDVVNEQSDQRDAFLALLERKGLQKILGKLPAAGAAALPRERPARAELRRGVPPTPRPSSDAGELGKGERQVLIAIAQHEAGVTREQITQLTGYRRSTRDTYIQRLTQKAFAELVAERVHATDAGIDALGKDFEPLPTGDELLKYWLQRLPKGERDILELLARHYPNAVDRERISDATGYARSSRDTYLQRLSARRIITTEGRGLVKASEELFS